MRIRPRRMPTRRRRSVTTRLPPTIRTRPIGIRRRLIAWISREIAAQKKTARCPGTIVTWATSSVAPPMRVGSRRRKSEARRQPSATRPLPGATMQPAGSTTDLTTFGFGPPGSVRVPLGSARRRQANGRAWRASAAPRILRSRSSAGSSGRSRLIPSSRPRRTRRPTCISRPRPTSRRSGRSSPASGSAGSSRSRRP